MVSTGKNSKVLQGKSRYPTTQQQSSPERANTATSDYTSTFSFVYNNPLFAIEPRQSLLVNLPG